MAPNSAEVICALGACDRIVGVSKFCVYPLELTGRAKVGGLFDPDLERITALRPDLLVMRGNNEALTQLCKALNVPVYRDETDSLAGIERCIRELGDVLGAAKEADDLARAFRARLDEIRERSRSAVRPRVLLTVSRKPERLAEILTAGKGTFLDEMLDIAGGANVFGHLEVAYPQVSIEGIIAQRPEFILELMPEVSLTEPLRRQMLDQWRSLGAIPAVERDRVIFITDDNCLIPSPRYADVIDKVSRILHPEPDRHGR